MNGLYESYEGLLQPSTWPFLAKTHHGKIGNKKNPYFLLCYRLVSADIDAESQTTAKSLCAMLATLDMNVNDIVEALDPPEGRESTRFVLNLKGMGVAVFDRATSEILWTDEKGLSYVLRERLMKGRLEPSTDFPETTY